MSRFFIGIDVGGTNLKAGLTDETGRLLAAARRPLDFRGAETFAADLADLAAEVLSTAGAVPGDAESVGIGLPGAVSGGEVLYTTNIPLERTDLAALFRRRLDLPVLLGNDADCAAVGEYFQGAGRGLRDFVVLTLGTGLGPESFWTAACGAANPPARRGTWCSMPEESPAPADAGAAGSSTPPPRR